MTAAGAPSGLGVLDDVALWQDTLAAEHAVIWSYGLVGATEGLAEPARAALVVHRDRRATCLDVIVGLGAQPVASAPAYDVTKPAGTTAGRRLAARLESSAEPSYLALSSSADRSTRLLAARWLRESAVAQTRWAGQVPALPGFEADRP